MRSGFKRVRKYQLSYLLAVLMIGACGGRNSSGLAQIDAPSTTCPTGAAAIRVGTAFLQILCGCTGADETPGKIYPVTTTMTCHLPVAPAGSSPVAFIYFQGITTNHQILPTGPESVPATQIITPSSPPAFGFIFPKAGTTYSFTDAIAGMTGQFITP